MRQNRFTPLSANLTAAPAPIPELAPVMMATSLLVKDLVGPLAAASRAEDEDAAIPTGNKLHHVSGGLMKLKSPSFSMGAWCSG